MKRFQINNTSWGYVVEAYWPDKDGLERWQPLRNFGDRKGDAIDFRDIDCPDLSDANIKFLIAKYDANRKYVRLRKGQYYKQRENPAI